ncbi:MAG: SIS domain-containing protein [Candidatus Melainabacteria bacterium]
MTTTPLKAPTETATQAGELDCVLSQARAVLDVEIEGLEAVRNNLGETFLQAVACIEDCQGRVIITGMGKSGHVARKIAATLSSTGTPAYFLHPAEGSHGDLGLLGPQDVVIAISYSGESPEISNILPLIKRLGVPLISMTGKPESTLARQSDISLSIQVPKEACPLNLAPTTSTTATLALGDALAVVLLDRKGFTSDNFAQYHPAGALGRRLLLHVQDLMTTGEQLPVVSERTPFMDALVEMSAKKLGLALVVNTDGRMVGMLTDGDVRRALMQQGDPRHIPLTDCMTRNPKQVSAEDLAEKALRLMETHKITALLITDEQERPVGVIHMHDILQAGIR